MVVKGVELEGTVPLFVGTAIVVAVAAGVELTELAAALAFAIISRLVS